MCKTWMLCDVISGEVVPTEGAKAEGITEAGWFRKDQLKKEVVYPPPVMEHDWEEFRSEHWEAQSLPTRIASF